MKKETYNLLIRLLAGVAASLILVGAIGLLGDGMSKGKQTEGLFYQVSGLHPDGELMNVDGESISVEEYLYRMSFQCAYLSAYMPGVDLSEQVTDGMTYGDYAKKATLEEVKQYAVIRKLAQDAGLTMTEDDLAQMDEMRKGYIEYYGDEETYLAQLSLLGISEGTFMRINDTATNETRFLYEHLKELYTQPDGAFYPDEAAIAAYAEAGGYVTAQILFIDTCEMDDDEKAEALETMEGYLAQLQEAEDRDAAFAAAAEELGMSAEALTLRSEDVESGLIEELQKTAVDELSGVISTEEGYYIAIRHELDVDEMLEEYFNACLLEACAAAKVTVNEKLYDAIDPAVFYPALMVEQEKMTEQLTNKA